MRWSTPIIALCVTLFLPTNLARGQTRPAPPPADQAAGPNRPGWAVDSRMGCWLWNPFPQAGETVSWSGSCDAGGRATGTGVAEWRVGGKVDHSEGEYSDGKKNGRGVYRSANGDRYTGEFRDDKFNGRGVMIFAKGGRYDGDWRDGKANGRGVFYLANGARYDGEWKDDRQHGRGTLTLPDGNWYEGEWRDGRANGRGVYMRTDGNRFAGEWRDGCLRDGRSVAAVGRPLADCE
jgi:hypothetical protein